jgi:hypothetical protein
MLASAASAGPRRSGRSAKASNCASSIGGFGRAPRLAQHAGEQHRGIEAPPDLDLAVERLPQVGDRRHVIELGLRPAEVEQDLRAALRRRGLVERALQVGGHRVRRAACGRRARGGGEPVVGPVVAGRLAVQQLCRHALR